MRLPQTGDTWRDPRGEERVIGAILGETVCRVSGTCSVMNSIAIAKTWTFVRSAPRPPTERELELQRSRRGMRTYSGLLVDPLDLRPDEVRIEDVAHHLSMICRFGGAVSRFYSVAEHSVYVALEAHERGGPVAALCGLLHDAHEAYLGDVIRPIKRRHATAKFTEDATQAVVEAGLGISPVEVFPAPVHALVKGIDDEICHDEGLALVHSYVAPERREASYSAHDFGSMSPAGAEAAFLRAYHELREALR